MNRPGTAAESQLVSLRRGTPLTSPRLDLVWLTLGTVVVTLVTFLARSWGSDGHLAPPVDDTFIHFQYARQLAAGHPFEYNTGDPPSSGDSAFIYPFLLAPAYLLGLDGMRVLLYADGLNLLAHLAAVLLVYKLAFTLGGRPLGLLSAIFLLMDGRLNGSFLSGMETGIYAAALIAFFWLWLRDVPAGRYALPALVGAFVALVRTEGHILVSAACVVTLFLVWRSAGGRWTMDDGRQNSEDSNQGAEQPSSIVHRPSSHALWLLLPVVVGLVPYAVNLATTGHWQFNTAASKSIWYVPYSPLYEKVSLSMGYLVTAVKDIYLGLAVGSSPFPVLALPVAILGVALAVRGSRYRPLHLLLVMTLVGGVGLALLLPPLHFYRYHQPYDFIFWLYISLGVIGLATRLNASTLESLNVVPGARKTFNDGGDPVRSIVQAFKRNCLWAGIAIAVMILPQLIASTLSVGNSARDIYYQQMAFSDWIRQYTPADARVGASDVGAHKYLSDRYIIDLVGLTYNDLRGAHFSGWGSVYDVLAALPEEQRPAYLLVHPNVSVNGVDESASQSLLTPLYSIRVQYPTITAGDTEVLYKINWEYALLDPAGPYLSHKDVQPLDALNVGSLEEEELHGYRPVARQPSISPPKSLVTTAHYEEEQSFSLTESGRRQTGWEEFTVKSEEDRPLIIVSRSRLDPGASQKVLVWANGRQVGVWEVSNERETQWQEYEYTIPAEFITGERTTLRMDVSLDPGGPGFTSYRYWVYVE